MNMDAADFNQKEYERALQILERHERNLDRLTFVRSLLLLICVLYFQNYFREMTQILNLRAKLDTLTDSEKNSTVFGFLAANQEIRNLVYVPNQKAQALIELIPRLAVFYRENLTLDNQSGQTVASVIEKAKGHPESIHLENQYLPNLTVPITHTALALVAFTLALASFFYFHYRRALCRSLLRHATNHLNRVLKLVFPDQTESALTSPELLSRATALRRRMGGGPIQEWKGKWQFRQAVAASFERVVALTGRSPFRLLNEAMSIALFAALSILVGQIVLVDLNLRPVWWGALIGMGLLGLPVAWGLHKLNEVFITRYGTDLPVLKDSGDL